MSAAAPQFIVAICCRVTKTSFDRYVDNHNEHLGKDESPLDDYHFKDFLNTIQTYINEVYVDTDLVMTYGDKPNDIATISFGYGTMKPLGSIYDDSGMINFSIHHIQLISQEVSILKELANRFFLDFNKNQITTFHYKHS